MPAKSKLIGIAASEQPQERLERLGAHALSDAELIAMILRSGSKGFNVLDVASQLLAQSGSLAQLITWKDSQFRDIKGIGKVKALQLVAVVEIGRRILASEHAELPIADTPEKVHQFMKPRSIGLEVEKFWTLCLNRKNRVVKLCETTSGTASSSLVHPREVFKEAIRYSASAVICAHNHPSGDPSPSAADIKITRQLREASKIVGVPILDHIILGNSNADPLNVGWYSFEEHGML